jgi:hypothetical protein
MKMLSSIEIREFRGIESLRAEDLGLVNLIVGSNECGKTTLLEAVELLAVGCDPLTLARSLTRRGEYRGASEAEREYDPSHLFRGHRVTADSPGFSVNGHADNGPVTVDCAIRGLARTEVYSGMNGSGESEISSDIVLGLACKSAIMDVKHEIPFTRNGGITHDELRRQRSLTLEKEDFFPYFHPAFSFVPPESFSASAMRELWDKVVLTPGEESVVQALRVIGPGIERIAFQSDVSSGNAALSAIKIKHTDYEYPIPLSSAGDGMRRLLALALAMESIKCGVLVVDEIDAGLHHSVMGKMWKLVIAAAKRKKKQVFATTHSLDCVHSLGRLYEEDRELCEGIRLHRIEKGLEHTVVCGPDDLLVAAEERFEVR